MTQEQKKQWVSTATEQELLQQYNRSVEAAAKSPMFSEEYLTHKADVKLVDDELMRRIEIWKFMTEVVA